ncbi:hypothetical protein [Halohasta salina]|uniref:hypothetical protein n=1 Tax=Halohasta salina TaxID=2961621 RepID=UPI0020A32668|nr:hypothetical protein [Halohasta salina]
MSTDRADGEPTGRGRLPTPRELQEGLLTLLFLVVLVGGMSVLVTVELAVRL